MFIVWRGTRESSLRAISSLIFVLALIPAGFPEKAQQAPKDGAAERGHTQAWTLVWSGEFAGKDGGLPDATKWTYDLGGGGWGNHELEYYTRRAENARIQDGKLAIVARRERYAGADGVSREYTSARLKTQGRFAQAYGRIEARIQLPAGHGMWPAFWMLGEDFPAKGWPTCGEIDIMENKGREPGTVYGSLHGPSTHGGTSDLSKTFTLPEGQRLSDGFHIYAVEWEPEEVRFFLDSTVYATFRKADWPAGERWVFDHPFFIILNLAVGGDFTGAPDATTVFPQAMLVDYVRVYRRSQAGAN
jgi:beta-glucanase (GH16 family)